jgi:hypothetical protein
LLSAKALMPDEHFGIAATKKYQPDLLDTSFGL